MPRTALMIAGWLLLVCLFPVVPQAEEATAVATETLTITTAETENAEEGAVTSHTFDIEIARTPVELKNGLMYRLEMAEDHGMLFIFPTEDQRGFWMKNTYIPLDMIFIRADGTIANIREKTKPHSLAPQRSEGPALAVLEINGGLSEKLGIKAGDTVHYKLFNNVLAE